MTAKRLGKGIGAIIPEFPQGNVESVHTVNEVNIDQINTNPHQPRKEFNVDAMSDLVKSIAKNGIIQPITIRVADNGFELIAGERRLRASKQAGLSTIPAYVLPITSDVEMMELALIENVQREDLNPIEESQAYQVLYDTFDLSHEEISVRVGKKRSTITNAMRLLNLPDLIIKDLREARLFPGHARPLLNLETEKQQLNLWRRIKDEGLSVRQVEQIVKNIKSPPDAKQIPVKKNKSVFIKSAEDKLMHLVGTKVKLKGTEKKGNIEIAYYSQDDLNRLLDIFDTIKGNLSE